MSKDKPKGLNVSVSTKPDTLVECHALVRADGAWIRLEASIPESVFSQHVTHVSDADIFGMHVTRLQQALNRQKERG